MNGDSVQKPKVVAEAVLTKRDLARSTDLDLMALDAFLQEVYRTDFPVQGGTLGTLTRSFIDKVCGDSASPAMQLILQSIDKDKMQLSINIQLDKQKEKGT